MVLVRLGTSKTPEKDHYRVIKCNGNEITAVNINSGRVLRRHLSRFTRILERPHQPQPPQQHIEEDHDQQYAPLPSGVQAPALPPVPQNVGNQNDLPPALNVGNRAPNDLPPQPRPQQQQHVRFHPRAHNIEYDNEAAIAPGQTTRQQAARTGVPVPDHPLPRSALEHSVQARATAQQLQDQYRQNVQETLQLDRPAQNGQNQN